MIWHQLVIETGSKVVSGRRKEVWYEEEKVEKEEHANGGRERVGERGKNEEVLGNNVLLGKKKEKKEKKKKKNCH